MKNLISLQACFQRTSPYGWDGDGENKDRGRRASLRIGLPKGAIVDPTLIAMQQEAKSLASSELPPRPASSHASEKLGSKPMSPCSFGAHPCRVHSMSKEVRASTHGLNIEYCRLRVSFVGSHLDSYCSLA